MQQMNFYCRSYCLLNMFRAPLCPSSGTREYYKSGCCLSYLVLGFQVVGMMWSWGLCVRFAGCCFGAWFSSCRYDAELRVVCPVCGLLLKAATQPSAPLHTDNLKTKAPNTTGSNHLYNTLELLMMGIMVPETCWTSNKICNKNICCI